MVTDLLGDLGPVRRTARASRFERLLNYRRTVFTLEVSQDRRGVQDGQRIPGTQGTHGVQGVRSPGLPATSRSRLRRVFARRLRATFGEQLSYEVESGQVSTNPLTQLRTRQQHEARQRPKQDDRRSFRKPHAPANLRGDHEPAPVAHRHIICPTHDLKIPPATT